MRVIFWNVDTQRDFMMPDGKLYVKGAEKITGKLHELTTFARKKGIKVVNTADFHTKESKEISDQPNFKTTFPEHCMSWDEGQEFICATYPKFSDDNYYIVNYKDQDIDKGTFDRARNIIILKDEFDVFAGNRKAEVVLDLLKPELVVVYGVAADVCVNYAVLGLLKSVNEFRQYDVVIVSDAIWGLDNSAMAKFNLYEDWLIGGASIASVDFIKKFVEKRR